MTADRDFVLCADDYALTPAVSRGILDLAAARRLGATSAMTSRPAWRALAGELAAIGPSIAVGLHFNLTLGTPLTGAPSMTHGGEFRPLPQLLARSHARRIAADDVRHEFMAQFDAFTEAFGALPAFVDGHQHVHVLPGIREVVLTCLGRLDVGEGFWIRDPADRTAAIAARRLGAPKALLVRLFARGFGAAARAGGLATNAGFAGFSQFAVDGDYGREFASYLAAPGPRHLVMCHPGHADESLRGLDPAIESRARELAFLASPRFPEACEAAGLRLARRWEVDQTAAP